MKAPVITPASDGVAIYAPGHPLHGTYHADKQLAERALEQMNCPARPPARYRQNQTVNQRALWIVIGGGVLLATLLAQFIGG